MGTLTLLSVGSYAVLFKAVHRSRHTGGTGRNQTPSIDRSNLEGSVTQVCSSDSELREALCHSNN